MIFDTDVDRGGAVDSRGEEINRNRLVAIASAIALETTRAAPSSPDSITSDGLKTYIEETLGGRHHRFKRGYKNVINEALRLNAEGVNCPARDRDERPRGAAREPLPSTTARIS